MTAADQNRSQEDLERDMERIAAHFNNSLSVERKEQVNKLVFQSLGGLDSPMTSMSSMDALRLSEEQKKKIQPVFDEL
jgi:RIO-like serine/threonine protein kinase